MVIANGNAEELRTGGNLKEVLFNSSFLYWTAVAADGKPEMLDEFGKTAPAPWVAYTRAGCDVGAFSVANIEFERLPDDVTTFYGAGSTVDTTVRGELASSDPATQQKPSTDYLGIAVHCAIGSPLCNGAKNAPYAANDLLPDEPGGYQGYRALYGNKFLQPVISPGGPVKNLDGQVIKDSSGDIGFPGYDGMIGPNALAYTLDMQTHGVPVTFTYLSDVHDSWTTGAGLGSGSATYESQLRRENAAFGTFFAGLAKNGITTANTLFVITADEGDHFVGSSPSPATCNGVTVACSYGKVGEVDGNLTGMLAGRGVTTPFDVAADSAPVIYVHGQPAASSVAVRAMERAAAGLTAPDLATGQGVLLTNYLADPVEMNILHMVTGDPKRTGTFALFANPDFWLSSGPAKCGSSCVSEPAGQDAWNHGDVAPAINTTWLGLAGPGVANLRVDNSIWSDHTDIQPTMMALLGLRDDYTPDGVVLGDVIEPTALPPAMLSAYPTLVKLGHLYTRLEAPVGEFGLDTLAASTRALASNAAGDATYTTIEGQLTSLGSARDTLATQIQGLLIGAEFGGQPLSTTKSGKKALSKLIAQGNGLLAQADALAH